MHTLVKHWTPPPLSQLLKKEMTEKARKRAMAEHLRTDHLKQMEAVREMRNQNTEDNWLKQRRWAYKMQETKKLVVVRPLPLTQYI